MKANEFYRYKINHDLKDNYGIRLTGEELFELMEDFASQCLQKQTEKKVLSAEE